MAEDNRDTSDLIREVEDLLEGLRTDIEVPKELSDIDQKLANLRDRRNRGDLTEEQFQEKRTPLIEERRVSEEAQDVAASRNADVVAIKKALTEIDALDKGVAAGDITSEKRDEGVDKINARLKRVRLPETPEDPAVVGEEDPEKPGDEKLLDLGKAGEAADFAREQKKLDAEAQRQIDEEAFDEEARKNPYMDVYPKGAKGPDRRALAFNARKSQLERGAVDERREAYDRENPGVRAAAQKKQEEEYAQRANLRRREKLEAMAPGSTFSLEAPEGYGEGHEDYAARDVEAREWAKNVDPEVARSIAMGEGAPGDTASGRARGSETADDFYGLSRAIYDAGGNLPGQELGKRDADDVLEGISMEDARFRASQELKILNDEAADMFGDDYAKRKAHVREGAKRMTGAVGRGPIERLPLEDVDYEGNVTLKGSVPRLDNMTREKMKALTPGEYREFINHYGEDAIVKQITGGVDLDSPTRTAAPERQRSRVPVGLMAPPGAEGAFGETGAVISRPPVDLGTIEAGTPVDTDRTGRVRDYATVVPRAEAEPTLAAPASGEQWDLGTGGRTGTLPEFRQDLVDTGFKKDPQAWWHKRNLAMGTPMDDEALTINNRLRALKGQQALLPISNSFSFQ